jgi:hypothetical protein
MNNRHAPTANPIFVRTRRSENHRRTAPSADDDEATGDEGAGDEAAGDRMDDDAGAADGMDAPGLGGDAHCAQSSIDESGEILSLRFTTFPRTSTRVLGAGLARLDPSAGAPTRTAVSTGADRPVGYYGLVSLLGAFRR